MGVEPLFRLLNAFKEAENLNLAINSAKAIGCNVVNVGHDDLVERIHHGHAQVDRSRGTGQENVGICAELLRRAVTRDRKLRGRAWSQRTRNPGIKKDDFRYNRAFWKNSLRQSQEAR